MGHLFKLKPAHSPSIKRILSSISVSFTLTTVQVPNLALGETKWITVFLATAFKETVYRELPGRLERLGGGGVHSLQKHFRQHHVKRESTANSGRL
jgi:hypothetical protein